MEYDKTEKSIITSSTLSYLSKFSRSYARLLLVGVGERETDVVGHGERRVDVLAEVTTEKNLTIAALELSNSLLYFRSCCSKASQ